MVFIWDSKRCKGVYCVDLGQSFQMSIEYSLLVFSTIYLQNLASIQPGTSPVRFRCLDASQLSSSPPQRRDCPPAASRQQGDLGEFLSKPNLFKQMKETA